MASPARAERRGTYAVAIAARRPAQWGRYLRGVDVRVTRLDVWINSLAIGVAFGVAAYLSDGAVDAIMIGLLAFFISFAVFDLLARDGRDGPDHER